ncbi:MAG: DUF4118 domain-containing protein [Oscillospiraceae bacterium]|nr:DUF4118 domain-containing protein [Oscillospiraceae bacterium]
MKRFFAKRFLNLNLKDGIKTVVILAVACTVCFLLLPVSRNDFHAPLIFVLAVPLISLYTNGYIYGIFGSIFAVFGVNYAFTYPYFNLNFSIAGYPLTFLCTFAVSTVVSTLTTKVKQSESLRLESQREMMRSNLLRAISHDLRTPPTSIIGSINAVLESGDAMPQSDKTRLLSDAKSDAEWLVAMVENLLSITRIQADPTQSLHKEPQAAEEILYETASRFRKQYPNIKVDILIPDEVLMVPMDAMLIVQVLTNLMANSAIHGKTTTKIALSVRASGSEAEFNVNDNGVGISKKKLTTLFEGGESSSGERTDGSRSMGIGLSVCKAIITAHGGRIWADEPESGASVTFTLPLEEVAENDNQAENTYN